MEPFAPIDTLMPLAMSAGQGANDYLGTIALGFIEVVFWIAIFYAALRFTLGADSLEGASVQLAAWFIRIFLIGTIAAFLLPTIIPALIEGAFEIGTGVSQGKMTAADFLLPSRLFKTGWTEVEVLMKHSLSRCVGIMSCATNSPLLVYYGIASLILFGSFIAMIIAVILSYVYFIMEGVGVMLTIAGKGSDRTDWIGRGGTATLITRFVQMVIMSAGLSLGLVMFEAVRLTGEPSLSQAVLTAVVALIIAVLVLKSEQIGSSVVGGMPGPGGAGTGSAVTMGAASLLAAGSMGALQIARSMASGGSAPNNPGGSNPPPPPPVRGGGPQVNGSGPGSGHGANPFAPGATTSAASQAGASSPSPRPGTAAQAAAAAISAQARALPPGTGAGAEAPTPQQWGDAKIMGTDIVGMTRSQAGAALTAHQNWYTARGNGTDAAAPSSHALKVGGGTDSGASADWMASGGYSKPDGGVSSGSATTAAENSQKPPQAAPSGHTNDGRFMIPANRVYAIGIGGGQHGTGYHGQGWNGVSLRKSGTAALTGTNRHKHAAAATARKVHFA